jgi:hypothetical protein
MFQRDHMTWILIVLCLALCLCASCHKVNESKAAPTGANATGAPAASTTPASAAAATAAAAPGGTMTASAPAPAGDGVIAAKPDFPVVLTASFTSASHPGAPGVLSNLGFAIKLTQDTKDLASKDIALTAKEAKAGASFTLPDCRIEVTPMIEPPIKLEEGKYGSYGGYRINVADATGQPLAIFEVDKTGKIARADAQGGNNLNLLLAAPGEQLYCYTIYRAGGSVGEPLLAIDLHPGEFETQTAKDASENSYEYRCPKLELTFRNSELAKDLQLSRPEDQSAVEGGSRGGGRRGGGGGGRGGH